MSKKFLQYQRIAEYGMLYSFLEVFIFAIVAFFLKGPVISMLLGVLVIILLVFTIINTIMSLIWLTKYINDVIDNLFKEYEKEHF